MKINNAMPCTPHVYWVFWFSVIILYGHSAASILIALGCNVKEVSSFLDHNQVSTTLNVYAHLFNSSSIGLMQKYDSILSGSGTR